MRVDQVVVAVPTRGQIGAGTMSMLERIRDLNPALPPIVFSVGHLSSYETRNDVAKFLLDHEEWQAVIMVDDDVVPSENNMLGLVDPLEVIGDFSIVGSAYPIFQPQVNALPMIAAFDHDPGRETWPCLADCWQRRGVHEVEAVGFGCVAIHRRVFENLSYPWFEPTFTKHGLMTDDIAFCHRVRRAGMKVACGRTACAFTGSVRGRRRLSDRNPEGA